MGLPADMTNHVVGPKISKREQVLISIFLVAILALSSGSMVAIAKSSSHVVTPNGLDDTANIQAALDSCVGAGSGCAVQLVAGTYYVSQIEVTGFQGSFVGMGQGATIIQALPACSAVVTTHCLKSPNPADNTDTTPFWGAPPTPVTGSNPWPALFTFVNVQLAMSGMSINEPYATPTPGWDNEVRTPYTGEPSWVTALEGEVLITGQTGSVTIDHLTVIGSVGDYEGYNTEGLVNYWGELLPTGWTPPPSPTTPPTALTDQIPLSGTFTLTNSVIIGNNPIIYNVRNAAVTISHDTVEDNGAALAALAVVFDVSNSKIVITQNQGIDVTLYYAVFEFQAWSKPACTATITSDCLLPSTLYVTENSFQLNKGANAVYLYDGGQDDFGTPSTLSAVVSGNTAQNTYACQGCAVIYSDDLKSVFVSMNAMQADGSPGIWVPRGSGQVVGNAIAGAYNGIQLGAPWGSTNDVRVTANVIKNSAQWGIAVVGGSSNNKIIGNFMTGTANGGYDLYWDQSGTGNVWLGNFCGDHSSSPPGLC